MRANSKARKPRAKKASATPGATVEGSGRPGRKRISLSAFERVLLDISTRFIALPSDRVDNEILLAQREVCESLGLEISSLWQMPPDNPDTVVSTHVYVPSDYDVPVLEMDAQEFFPWSMVRLARGETVVLSRMTDIPADGARDLEIFRYYRIQSSICFPLSAGGGPMFGAVAFDTYTRQQLWSPKLIEKLRLVAQIFAHALARKRAEEALKQALAELEERLKFESLLSEISARFINLPANRIDSEIENSQFRICELLALDRSTLWEALEEDPGMLLLKHVRHPAGSPSPPEPMSAREFFPWTTQKILDGETVIISKMADLPPEGSRDRENYRAYGTASAVSVPLSVGEGPVFGLMSFALMHEEKSWSETAVNRFKLIAQVFAHALAGKRSDQLLAQSEARYRGIFEESIEGIFRTTPEGRILIANPALAKMLGFDSPEALIRTITDLGRQVWVDPEERSRHTKKLEEGETIRDFECQFKRKDGTKIWVSLSTRPVRGRDGRIVYFEGFVEDITGHKQADLALAESKERYRTLFELAPMGIILIGTDGCVRAANALQARLYGYESPQQLEGFYAPLFVSEKDRERASQNMRNLLQGEKLLDRTYTAVRRDGSEFMVEVTSETIWGPRQEAQGYLCITQDITKSRQDEDERVQLRQELAHLARVMAMTELSSSLAHEINQPLGAILNNAEAARSLLARAKEERLEIGEIIEDIIQDAQRAGDVVRKIRGLVKKGEAKFEPLSVNVLIGDVVKLVNNSLIMNSVMLQLDLKPDLPNVRGDRVRLQQVLMNLMTNAIDAMKQTPSRVLQVRSAAPAADEVIVSICDSGTGIAKAGNDAVFKPFFTTKKEGLGMGLPICQSIVEEHGGRIWGENNPTGGATFSFALKTWREKEVLD
jgi:two-component system, LuxR family, sensor kinase FixL